MQVNFTYDRIKDIWCLLNKGRSSNNSKNPTKQYEQLVAKFGENPTAEDVAVFVDEYIILPQNTDYKTVDIAAHTFFTKLLRYNIRIHQYPEMLHAKVAVIDDAVFIGSLNLDNVSLRYNFENGVFIRDTDVSLKVHEDIETLKKNSRRVEYKEWLNRSWWDKFLEKIVGLFKGLL